MCQTIQAEYGGWEDNARLVNSHHGLEVLLILNDLRGGC